MLPQKSYRKLGCAECLGGAGLTFDFSMAFQPIVDVTSGRTFGHEALVRGPSGEGAATVFENVHDGNKYQFDQACRAKAIELGSRLVNGEFLSINFMPLAVYRPELCIRVTLEAAERYGFPLNKIIFEFTESEKLEDVEHIRSIVNYYRKQGFLVAIDDFGAGYAGLNLLAELQTDILKLDMALIRGIDMDPRRRSIAAGVVKICQELSMTVIAEGIETRDEASAMRDLGVGLFQGYYFGKPTFESIAPVEPQKLLF